jgi:hypothetical protein
VNDRLAEYVKWWDLFDICVQVCDRVFHHSIPEWLLHTGGIGSARFPPNPFLLTCTYINGACSRNMR